MSWKQTIIWYPDREMINPKKTTKSGSICMNEKMISLLCQGLIRELRQELIKAKILILKRPMRKITLKQHTEMRNRFIKLMKDMER